MTKSIRILTILFSLAFVFGFAANANAVISITNYDPGTGSGITTFSYSVNGNTIDIYETWTVNAYGYLLISGLSPKTDYTINKWMTNSTGTDWGSFSNELLDPAGNPNDSLDVVPQPVWIPSGWTTSNDQDGLSFAQTSNGQQGSNIPRTSTVFTKLNVDEATDARDFLDFYRGTISGASGQDYPMSFGLRDYNAANDGFLITQRPNVFVPGVPEPASMILFGIGALGFGVTARKKKKVKA